MYTHSYIGVANQQKDSIVALSVSVAFSKGRPLPASVAFSKGRPLPAASEDSIDYLEAIRCIDKF